MRRPFPLTASWPEHVRDWTDRQGLVYASYEELLSDTRLALGAILSQLTSAPLQEDKLALVVRRHSFEIQAGRPRGQVVQDSFHRSGIVGGWRDYFSKESADIFDHFAGTELVRLGYEPHRSWTDRLFIGSAKTQLGSGVGGPKVN